VIFLGIEPVLFDGLQGLRDGGIGIGFGLLGLYGNRSGKKKTEETDGYELALAFNDLVHSAFYS
jgi:hypothetical protein